MNPIEQPADIVQAFVDAWNRRDADGIAALFDEDAEFVNVTGLWWHDRESIRKAHAYGLSRIFSTSDLRFDRLRVKWLGTDVAIVHARLILQDQSPHDDNSKPGTRSTVMTFVVHRHDTTFRCAAAHNTDIVPGAETNIITQDGTIAAVSYQPLHKKQKPG